MSEVLDRLLGSLSLSPWPGEDSEASGSQWDSSYDYSGYGDHIRYDPDAESSFGIFKKDKDHSGTGVNSGYGNDNQDEECCPLVVDKLCVLAILLSIAGASIFLARTFQIELCNVNGADVNTPCVTGRKKRALGYYEEQLQLVLEGKHHEKVRNFIPFLVCVFVAKKQFCGKQQEHRFLWQRNLLRPLRSLN